MIADHSSVVILAMHLFEKISRSGAYSLYSFLKIPVPPISGGATVIEETLLFV